RRYVVNIGTTGDNVTIRFTTDNAGPWFIGWSESLGTNCYHIDWHLEVGLSVIFAEGVDSWTTAIDPTNQWDQLCPIYDALPEKDL
ncbi:hypothetical protein CPB85DRAFT_1225159, partial [Mucidula mucida]